VLVDLSANTSVHTDPSKLPAELQQMALRLDNGYLLESHREQSPPARSPFSQFFDFSTADLGQLSVPFDYQG